MDKKESLSLIKALEEELNLSLEERNFLEQRNKFLIKFQNKISSELGFIKGALRKKVKNEEKLIKFERKLLELQLIMESLDLEDLK